MRSIEERIRKLETTFARLCGGGVVLAVVVLGFFGFTTLHQIPSEVSKAIPKNIQEEIRQSLVRIEESESKAHTAASELISLSKNYRNRIEGLEKGVAEQGVYFLENVACGETKRVRVPIDETTTENWVVLGINPQINAEEIDQIGDNAIYSFETSISPSDDKKFWTVGFLIKINNSTRNTSKSIKDCTWDRVRSRPEMQFVAIRKAVRPKFLTH